MYITAEQCVKGCVMGCATYIVCDNIVIVILTMCDLKLSNILQKKHSKHIYRVHTYVT